MLHKEASAVAKSTPDVSFYFAKRGSEANSGIVPMPPFSVGCRCMSLGCGRRFYLSISLHLMLGIDINIYAVIICGSVAGDTSPPFRYICSLS